MIEQSSETMGWGWAGRVVLRTVQGLSQRAAGVQTLVLVTLVTISLSVDICHCWPPGWAVKASPQSQQRLSTTGGWTHWVAIRAKVSCWNPWVVPSGKNLGLARTCMGRTGGG